MSRDILERRPLLLLILLVPLFFWKLAFSDQLSGFSGFAVVPGAGAFLA
jgi:hypothetical protein